MYLDETTLVILLFDDAASSCFCRFGANVVNEV